MKTQISNIVIEDAIKIKLNTSKYNEKLKEAQLKLSAAIQQDMLPYMPMQTGNMMQRVMSDNVSNFEKGIILIAPAPYGRYLYEGKVMVDSETGKGARPIKLKTGEVIYRHKKGSTLVPTERPLTYARAGARDHWYEEAKAANYDRWLQVVEDIVGGKIKHG